MNEHILPYGLIASSFIIVPIIFDVILRLLVKYEILNPQIFQPDTSQLTDRLHPPWQLLKRMVDLDVAKGLTIAVMIFVNYGGANLPLFQHAIWDGMTIADTVLPMFIFLSGVSHAISTTQSYRRNENFSRKFVSVLFRTIQLIFLGLIVNQNKDWANFRFCGVLQRIALCQFLFFIIHHCTSGSTLRDYMVSDIMQRTLLKLIRIRDLLIVFGIAGIATAAMLLVKLEGCPRGYIGSGGYFDKDLGKYANCTGGLERYVDALIMGEAHLYNNPTCRQQIFCFQNFDPEGLYSTFFALINYALGFQVGVFIVFAHTERHACASSSIVAIVSAATGLLLAYFTPLQLNKNLWTLSFALVNVGISISVLLIFRLFFNFVKSLPLRIFSMAGEQCLDIYVASEIIHGIVPTTWPVEFSTKYTSPMLMTLSVLWSSHIFLLLNAIRLIFRAHWSSRPKLPSVDEEYIGRNGIVFSDDAVSEDRNSEVFIGQQLPEDQRHLIVNG